MKIQGQTEHQSCATVDQPNLYTFWWRDKSEYLVETHTDTESILAQQKKGLL